jgi:hypothetical protein
MYKLGGLSEFFRSIVCAFRFSYNQGLSKKQHITGDANKVYYSRSGGAILTLNRMVISLVEAIQQESC